MKRKTIWLAGNFDNLLLASTALLVVLGLIILYSLGIKAKQVSNQLDSTRQIVYALIGVFLLVLLLFCQLSRYFQRYSEDCLQKALSAKPLCQF